MPTLDFEGDPERRAREEENPFLDRSNPTGGNRETNTSPLAQPRSTSGYTPSAPPLAWQGSTFMNQPGGPMAPWDAPQNWTAPRSPVSASGSGNLTSWWNPNDPQGSFQQLVNGRSANSASLMELAPYLQAIGGRLENPNAAGVTSKAYFPGMSSAVRVGNYFDSDPSEGFTPSWGWTPQPGGEGGGGGGSSQGTDVYVNEILSRLQQLRQPVNDPFKDLLQLMALKRVDGLGGAPYTEGEDAALRAHYMEPLTHARDEQRQNARERAGARGFLPTSGLLDEMTGQVDDSYNRAVAGASNDLSVRAVDEKQRRSDQQLSILADMLGVNRNFRQEDDQRGQSLVNTAGLLKNLDFESLNALLQSSGDTGAGANNVLSEIARLTQGNQQNGQQRDDQSAAMWGQIIASIIGGLG